MNDWDSMGETSEIMALLTKDEYEKLKEYNADDETAAKIALKLEQLSDEARLSGDMKELQILRALYKTGKTEEFEIKCKEMLDRWIKEIRSI